MTTFSIPSRIQSRLDRKASPAPKQAQPSPAPAEASDIIPILDWPAYRELHPELVFTGRFDLQGRAIFTDHSPAPISERTSP